MSLKEIIKKEDTSYEKIEDKEQSKDDISGDGETGYEACHQRWYLCHRQEKAENEGSGDNNENHTGNASSFQQGSMKVAPV